MIIGGFLMIANRMIATTNSVRVGLSAMSVTSFVEPVIIGMPAALPEPDTPLKDFTSSDSIPHSGARVLSLLRPLAKLPVAVCVHNPSIETTPLLRSSRRIDSPSNAFFFS
jgi:hypothetical protein